MKYVMIIGMIFLVACYPVGESLFSNMETLDHLHGIMIDLDGEMFTYGSEESITMPVHSVTKSVISLLVGIAIDHGVIGSVDDLVSSYLDFEEGDSYFETLTIRDLLTMTSGLDWTNCNGDQDTIGHAIGHGFVSKPGSHFRYTSYTTNLLAKVLMNATGVSPDLYAEEYLFNPLGIESFRWQKDMQGMAFGSSGLEMTLEDMVILGRMLLDRGGQEDLVSSSWLEEMTTIAVEDTGESDLVGAYGYLWWLGEVDGLPLWVAEGYGGQYIIVIEEIAAVIAVQSHTLEDQANMSAYMVNLEGYLMNQLIPELKRRTYSKY